MGYLQADQLLGLSGLGAGYVSKAGMTQAQQTAERNRQIQAERQAKADAYERAIAPVRARNEARLAASKAQIAAAKAAREEAARLRPENHARALQKRREQQEANQRNLQERAQIQDAARQSSVRQPASRPTFEDSKGKITSASSYTSLIDQLYNAGANTRRDYDHTFNELTNIVQSTPQNIWSDLSLPASALPEVITQPTGNYPGSSLNQTMPLPQYSIPTSYQTTPLPQMSQVMDPINKPVGGLYTGGSIQTPYGRAGSTGLRTGESGGKTFNLADYLEVTEPPESF